MRISADSALPQEPAPLAAAGSDAASFGQLLESATPKSGKAARKRTARPVQGKPPATAQLSGSSLPEPAAGPARSRPGPTAAREADPPLPSPLQPHPNPGEHSPGEARLHQQSTAAPHPVYVPPSPLTTAPIAPTGPVPKPDPAAGAAAANSALQDGRPAEADIASTAGAASAPALLAKAGTSRAAPATAPSSASASAAPHLPDIRIIIQSAEPSASQAGLAPAPLAPRSPAPSAHHAAAAIPGTGSRSAAPEPLANSGGTNSDSGSGSERSSRTQALATASTGFSLPSSEAGSFRSEVENAHPDAADAAPDMPGGAAAVDDQAQHLGDQPASFMADIVISLSEDARLDVTLGAASQEDAMRMEAGTASLQAELAAHGTEVEAIRVELRPEPAPDAPTGSSSAAWLQNGASHGWTGSREGGAADRSQPGLPRSGLSARLQGAGAGTGAAGSIGKVDRYA